MTAPLLEEDAQKMTDAIVEMVQNIMGSPWVYVALFAFAAIDSFFPVVPSESLVIAAGVFAASGEPNLLLVILFSAAGAFLGDHISYFIGRTAGTRLRSRFVRGERGQAAFAWAERTLATRGGLILVVARYIPGGRTAVTITAGTVEYPLRKFSFYDAIAALSWGTYSALIGYFGGKAFEHDPIKGLAVGFGVALAITGLVELTRHLLARRKKAAQKLDVRDDGGAKPEEKV